eukprot:TRINITY_DN26637_c0_g2_i1.p1 TRINITY_DN26637_c0_g2~~TRINITY_DN26637_c0_g2_i1.p1  ORF type:complete len:467 (-),score=93.96 TRINITY_DN26637_c0_g2_i1:137-1375(-)
MAATTSDARQIQSEKEKSEDTKISEALEITASSSVDTDPDIGPDIVGYLKQMVSLIISDRSSYPLPQNQIGAQDCRIPRQNPSNLFQGGIGGCLLEAQKERLGNYLKECVAVMNQEVDQVTENVLQLYRKRGKLKRKMSQTLVSSKPKEAKKDKKKHRMIFLARSEAAHRRQMTNICRQLGDVLEEIMQHRLYPSIGNIDMSGSTLFNYSEGKRTMDLEGILNRIEVIDATSCANIREIYEDVKCFFRNHMAHSSPGSELYRNTKTLMEKFEEKWRSDLEPKLIELEEKREQEQGFADVGEVDNEASLQIFTNKIFKKLESVENDLEDFITAVASCSRPMSSTETEELVRRISCLPPNGLNRVIEILSGENCLDDVSADELHVNLEEEDSETLWRLYIYLQTVANANDSLHK